MRPMIALAALLLSSASVSAACQCVCDEGTSRPICGPYDLMRPICQQLCPPSIRAVQVVRPLAGGQPQYGVVGPFNPAPGGLIPPEQSLDLNDKGLPLGTAGSLSPGPGYGAAGAVTSGASGR